MKKADSLQISLGDVWELINKPRRFWDAVWTALYKLDNLKDERGEDALSEEWGSDKKKVINTVLRYRHLGYNPLASARECRKNVTEVLKFLDNHYIEMNQETEAEIMMAIANDIADNFDPDEYFDAYSYEKEEEKERAQREANAVGKEEKSTQDTAQE